MRLGITMALEAPAHLKRVLAPHESHLVYAPVAFGAGQVFGEMSLMTGDARAATCVARTDTVAYVVDHATVQKVHSLRPGVTEQMTAVLLARQAVLEKKGGEVIAAIDPASERSRRLLSRIRDFFDLG